MTGKELKDAVDNCNEQCQNCLIYRPDEKHKCVKEWCVAWQKWANDQHKEFMNEE